MDKEINILATILSNSNLGVKGLKKVMWEGTEHWDQLLKERAISSGTLVLSDFTINAINKFKQK